MRLATAAVCSLVLVTGCAQLHTATGTNIDRASDLGLVSDATLPPPISSVKVNYTAADRDAFVELWMTRSDYLCRKYKDKLIMLSRDMRLTSDVTSTVLSGLAAIAGSLGVVHPLTAGAAIVTGVGAAAENDTFAQQTGDILAAAIQTARANQANQIERNLALPVSQYNIYRAARDVIDYHNMCSLENALDQIRTSLRATAPDGGSTPPAAQGTPVRQ